MTARRIIAIAITLAMLSACNLWEKTSPDKIFERVIAQYNSMQTYKDKGTITTDINTGAMKMTIETSFSILLKKPNLYLISWTQKNMLMPGMVHSGAVWSNGTQPYLYMGIFNAYSKMGNDQLALGGATGISSGAAFTIPSLFLTVFNEPPTLFSRLKDAKMEKTEKIGEDDCYVISGSSAISKKETFWISKKSYLIKKYLRSLEPPEGGHQMPEIKDEHIEETIKGMGLEVTEERKKNMRENMEKSAEMLKTLKMEGSSTEVHTDISSPELHKNDFNADLPEGAVLKKSLFGRAFNGSMWMK